MKLRNPLSKSISLTLLVLMSFAPSAVTAESLKTSCAARMDAHYIEPTQRYDHGVLGDAIEYGALEVQLTDCDEQILIKRAILPQSMVFEDIKPRLVDLDGDQQPEIITIEASVTDGARLAVWKIKDNELVRAAVTPYIGRAYRWLAPIGAADFDNDGYMEIAYIDRPHLAQTLRIWRYQNNALTQITNRSGFTNHRIGEDYISGGIRDCGRGSEMITADSDWANVVAIRLHKGNLESRILGPFKGQQSFAKALACEKTH